MPIMVHYQKIRKPLVIFSALLFHVLLIFHLLFSPVIIVVASQSGIANASFVAFLVIFGLSLFFGRAYCSWFCPGCGIQEVVSLFVKRKSKSTKANYIKYFIFTIWMGFIIIGYLLNGIHQIDLKFGMTDISAERKIILTVGAFLIIVPITALFGKFASCKYICWQAPIMILGTTIRDYCHFHGLRLKAAKENCTSCGKCIAECPMDIDVMAKVKTGKMSDSECILCGNCIDGCKQNVIKYNVERN